MTRHEAVDTVITAVRHHPAVKAVFLKGSMADNTDDNYSDVDFYCLVREDKQEAFLADRLDLLSKYKPLVYWSEANFVGPQIVAVFADGLHFDLYTVTEANFPHMGNFKILYDPENLLPTHLDRVCDFSVSPGEVETWFHEFAFTILEFEAAWQRQDICWGTRLASHLSGNLAGVLRHKYEPQKAMLGMKRLEQCLPLKIRDQLREALFLCTGTTLPRGVQLMSGILEAAIKELEEEQCLKLNRQLWELVQTKLAKIIPV